MEFNSVSLVTVRNIQYHCLVLDSIITTTVYLNIETVINEIALATKHNMWTNNSTQSVYRKQIA